MDDGGPMPHVEDVKAAIRGTTQYLVEVIADQGEDLPHTQLGDRSDTQCRAAFHCSVLFRS
jgi:hypothetical protein